MTAPKLVRSRVFGVKSQSGDSAESLTAGDCIEVISATFVPQPETMAQTSMSGRKGGLRQPTMKRMGQITVSLFLKPTGDGGSPTSLAPQCEDLLEAIGLERKSDAESPEKAYYEPYAGSGVACTAAVWQDGVKYEIYGALGDGTITLNVDEFPMLEVTLTGVFDGAAEDESNPSPTFDTGAANPSHAASFTIGGYSPKSTQLSIALNNQVQSRGSHNATYGVVGFIITDFNPTLTMTCELDTAATKDFIALIGSTYQAISFTNGDTEGEQIVLTAPALDIQNADPSGDNGGINTVTVTGVLRYDQGTDTPEFRLSWQ